VDILKNSDEKKGGQCVTRTELSTTVPGRGEADTEHADTVLLPLFSETKITSSHLRNFLWRYGTKYGSIIKRIPIVRTIAEMLFQDRTLAKVLMSRYPGQGPSALGTITTDGIKRWMLRKMT